MYSQTSSSVLKVVMEMIVQNMNKQKNRMFLLILSLENQIHVSLRRGKMTFLPKPLSGEAENKSFLPPEI